MSIFFHVEIQFGVRMGIAVSNSTTTRKRLSVYAELAASDGTLVDLNKARKDEASTTVCMARQPTDYTHLGTWSMRISQDK